MLILLEPDNWLVILDEISIRLLVVLKRLIARLLINHSGGF